MSSRLCPLCGRLGVASSRLLDAVGCAVMKSMGCAPLMPSKSRRICGANMAKNHQPIPVVWLLGALRGRAWSELAKALLVFTKLVRTHTWLSVQKNTLQGP